MKAVIWNNQSDKGDYFSVSLAKVYEDRNGKIQETNSFSEGELLRIAELAKEAKTFILERNRERSLERSQQPDRDQGDARRFQDESQPSMAR